MIACICIRIVDHINADTPTATARATTFLLASVKWKGQMSNVYVSFPLTKWTHLIREWKDWNIIFSSLHFAKNYKKTNDSHSKQKVIAEVDFISDLLTFRRRKKMFRRHVGSCIIHVYDDTPIPTTTHLIFNWIGSSKTRCPPHTLRDISAAFKRKGKTVTTVGSWHILQMNVDAVDENKNYHIEQSLGLHSLSPSLCAHRRLASVKIKNIFIYQMTFFVFSQRR